MTDDLAGCMSFFRQEGRDRPNMIDTNVSALSSQLTPSITPGVSGQSGTAERKPYLQIQYLIKTFGSFSAVDDVSLEIYKGEFVCVLGPSGCGKTTLLRLIAGIEVQDSGTIWQNGADISRMPPSKRDFGIVFQSYALFPNLTVFENVAYGLRSTRTPRAQITTMVQNLLMLVGMPDAGKKFPSQLSAGQQQRIALVRALALSPGLLLLDEPLSALDARVRTNLRKELTDIQRRIGVTTVMVTHDQEEALTMADRIVVMNRGAIQQVGTPTEIYEEPSTPFVADFIGEMNFLPASVIEPWWMQCGEAKIASPYALEFGVNTPVTLAIRPEKIKLSNDISGNVSGHAHIENSTNNTNSLAVSLSKVEFLGSFYRLHLQPLHLPQNGIMADLSPDSAALFSLIPGAVFTVQLPEKALMVYRG